MKINKTLAAGIAATLAVTSLASVASAIPVSIPESTTWDMAKTFGKIVYKPGVAGVTAVDPGDYFDFVGDTKQEGKEARDFKLANAAEANVDTNLDGKVTDLDFDYYIPFKVVAETEGGAAITGDDAKALINCFDKISVVISGKRIASNGATTENVTQTVDLVQVNSATYGAGTDANYILPIYNGGSPADGCFIPERFVQVDKIDFKVSSTNSITFVDIEQADYELIEGGTKGKNGVWHPSIVKTATGLDILFNGAIKQYWDGEAAKVKIRLADAYNDTNANGYDNNTVCYPVTGVYHVGDTDKDGNVDDWSANLFNAAGAEILNITGGEGKGTFDLSDDNGVAAPAVEKHDGGLLLSKIRSTMANGASIYFDANGGTFSTYDTYAWLPRTEDPGDGNEIIQRHEVWCLSDTNDLLSWSDNRVNTGAEIISDVQTYEIVDEYGREGTIPRGFNGMASKFADTFNRPGNPYKEAKVIFTFEAYVPAAGGTTWKNGGIPSTEVGLRNFIAAAKPEDFALFVNYNATTGSLQAAAVLDKESGAVEFNVSEILKDLGGHTIGTVQDIYYGLNNGITQPAGALREGQTGLWVKTVTYVHEKDDAADTAAASDKTEEKEETKTETKTEDKEEDNDKEIDLDNDNDKETEIPADTSNNGGSAVVDNGANKADENPHTGVALAVIPAIVAGAAVVASKKRK